MTSPIAQRTDSADFGLEVDRPHGNGHHYESSNINNISASSSYSNFPVGLHGTYASASLASSVTDSRRKSTSGPHFATLLEKQLHFCRGLIDQLRNHKNASWFVRPVDPILDHVPDYFKIIKNPMDLRTISEKLDRGDYRSPDEVHADFKLIVSNCRQFNGEKSLVTTDAYHLDRSFDRLWRQLPQEHGSKKRKAEDEEMYKSKSSRTSIGGSKGPRGRHFEEMKFIKACHKELMHKKHYEIAFFFYLPVDELRDGAPDYYKKITSPMDLDTIGKKIERDEYSSFADFERDVRLMFSNCRRYNSPGTVVFEAGRKLLEIFENKVAQKPDFDKMEFEKALSLPASSKGTPPPGKKSKDDRKKDKKDKRDKKDKKDRDDDEDDDDSDTDDEGRKQVKMLEKKMRQLEEKMIPILSKGGEVIKKEKKSKDSKKKKKKSSSDALKSSSGSKPVPKKPSTSSNSKSRPPPKNKDDIPMTVAEKEHLSKMINDHLPQEQIGVIFEILQRRMPALFDKASGDEVELDIDVLDTGTLREIERHVERISNPAAAKPPAPKRKRPSASQQAQKTIQQLNEQIEKLKAETKSVKKSSDSSSDDSSSSSSDSDSENSSVEDQDMKMDDVDQDITEKRDTGMGFDSTVGVLQPKENEKLLSFKAEKIKDDGVVKHASKIDEDAINRKGITQGDSKSRPIQDGAGGLKDIAAKLKEKGREARVLPTAISNPSSPTGTNPTMPSKQSNRMRLSAVDLPIVHEAEEEKRKMEEEAERRRKEAREHLVSMPADADVTAQEELFNEWTRNFETSRVLM